MDVPFETLKCDVCGAAVADLYHPFTVMTPGPVTCKQHGSQFGIGWHLPSDAEVPAAIRFRQD